MASEMESAPSQPPEATRNRLLSCILHALVAFLISGLVFSVWWVVARGDVRYESISIGMSERAVRQILGEPEKIFIRTPVYAKVCVYVLGPEKIAVYFDAEGRVELKNKSVVLPKGIPEKR
jgi:hypothetical protein